jgi:hypothetical protein
VEFTLYYRGELKANGGAKEKHLLRQYFHRQLRELWKQTPLNNYTKFLQPKPGKGDLSVIRTIRDFNFAPLVSEKLHFVAELNISLLRPEAPGSIITRGGDIDNRLKTLLDAVKVPSAPNDLPADIRPQTDENPFFCLLEDDNLITKLSVQTDRLLEPPADRSEVVLQIHVVTRKLIGLTGTMGLA